MIERKVCRICNTEKIAEEFYKHKTNSDGLHSYCKVCAREKSSKWGKENREKKYERTKKRMKENPEYYRWYRKRYYDNNRDKVSVDLKNWQNENKDRLKMYRIRRMQNKKHEITLLEWESCKKYFNYCCAYCGMSLEDHKLLYNQDFHKEHVDHKGANDLSNCVPSCKTCNSSKWTFEFSVWYTINNPSYSTSRYTKILNWLEKDFKSS